MDSSGCPSGKATDVLVLHPLKQNASDRFLPNTPRFQYDFKPCDVDLASFWMAFAFLLVIRCVGHVIDLLAFAALEKHKWEVQSTTERNGNTKKRKMSYGILLDVGLTVWMLLVYPLAGTGFVTSSNGTFPFLQSSAFVLANVQIYFTTLRLVKLWVKMVPTGVRSTSKQTLKQRDHVIFVAYTLLAATTAASVVCGALSIRFAGESNLFGVLIFPLGNSAAFSSYVVVLRQTVRITGYIRNEMNSSKAYGQTNKESSEKALNSTIQRLWVRQAIHFLYTVPIFIVLVLGATFTIKITWILVYFFHLLTSVARSGTALLLQYRIILKRFFPGMLNGNKASNKSSSDVSRIQKGNRNIAVAAAGDRNKDVEVAVDESGHNTNTTPGPESSS